jgi:uncharacterized membrane protein
MGETLGDKAIRLWPPIALAAMLALGWAVGKGSTPVDDWFHRYRHSHAQYLLFFTDPRVLALVAVAYCALGMIGQGVSYHYFTDTVGALLLGTAIVCTAAWLAEPT